MYKEDVHMLSMSIVLKCKVYLHKTQKVQNNSCLKFVFICICIYSILNTF